MFSFLCLTLSSAILFFILKYRVHIHVTYTPRVPATIAGKRQARKLHTGRALSQDAAARQGFESPAPADSLTRDIAASLRNLGASPAKSRIAAARATAKTCNVDEALKLAIQYATTKEAA